MSTTSAALFYVAVVVVLTAVYVAHQHDIETEWWGTDHWPIVGITFCMCFIAAVPWLDHYGI